MQVVIYRNIKGDFQYEAYEMVENFCTYCKDL